VLNTQERRKEDGRSTEEDRSILVLDRHERSRAAEAHRNHRIPGFWATPSFPESLRLITSCAFSLCYYYYYILGKTIPNSCISIHNTKVQASEGAYYHYHYHQPWNGIYIVNSHSIIQSFSQPGQNVRTREDHACTHRTYKIRSGRATF
jgi:hypothetical protein